MKAPEGAPNVVIVLIDDIGFGHASTFGGADPHADARAARQPGAASTTASTPRRCARPTRVALLTGRNHHTNNAGAIMEAGDGVSRATPACRPQSVTPLAEILRQNGYSTAAFGKYHETAAVGSQRLRAVRPLADALGLRQVLRLHRRRDQPVGAARSTTAPSQVEPPHDPNYHFTTDMTNQAISWIRSQQSLTPDKPFFMYFATGATHAPHHVPKEWIEKYKGKFDGGWDKYREETFARQKQLGVVPAEREARAEARRTSRIGTS